MKTLFLLLFSSLCLSSALKANDYTVTVKGFVFGIDKSRAPGKQRFPLAGLKIELMDSDADGSQIFDDLMGTAVVNADGSFTVSGKGGDPGSFSFSKPDVYVRFVYNYYDKVRLTDELNRTRYTNTPEHDHNDFEGTLDIGTWEIGNDLAAGEASMCGVWEQVCRAWDNYVALMGEAPKSGYCDVEYWSAIAAGTPWTNDNTIHWPIHYTSSAAAHEFGHIIRHSFDGDRNHFNWDVTRFRYARNHSSCDPSCNNWSTESADMNRGFAFNEGWAEFWSDENTCNPKYSSECEGGVAHILKDLEQTLAKSNPQPRKLMCRVLKNNPGSIHSVEEFIAKLNAQQSGVPYVLNIARLPRYVEVKFSPVPPVMKQATVAYAATRLQKITQNIQALNTVISTTKANEKLMLTCQGNDCNKYAEQIITLTATQNEKERLVLQQQLFQKGGQGNYYEDIFKMRLNNSIDPMMKSMKDDFDKRANDIDLRAAKDAISRLQGIKNKSPYITSLIAELNEHMKKASLTKALYSAYKEETAAKSNQ